MRKGYTNIIILTISLLVGIGVIEIVLRGFYPIYFTGYVSAYQYDETLGVRLKDNIHFYKSTDYQQEIYTNKFGTINLQDSFTEYDITIFAIGDSYTQGTGLPADASYPFQLSMILNIENDEYLSRYAVINLGLSSFGTKQEILSLSIYKNIYGNPDYILYFGTSNDYMDDIRFEGGYRHKHLVDGSPHWSVLLKPLQWFTNDTEIGKRLKMAVAYLRLRSYSKNNSDKKKPNKGKVSVAKLQEGKLEELLIISKNMNAQLIVSWSDLPQASSNSYGWLKQWAEENRVSFADWHPKVESTLKAIPKLPTTNPHSGGHYRTWVNNIIAKSFSEHIQGRSYVSENYGNSTK